MNIVSSLDAWRQIRKKLTAKTIGFVPTMGNLHEGHLSICQQSLAENEITVAGIFVNPTQFNQTSDFDCYPRTLEQDQKKLTDYGVDYLLLPTPDEMYHDQYQVRISEIELATILEGEYRPGHFTGMLTVIMKLLNLVLPTRAYFGEKDYQQYLLVKKMADALFMNVEIISHPTCRAADGLALSSRNSRLSVDERAQAAHFPRLLSSENSLEYIQSALTELGFKVEYIAEKWGRRLGAVWLNEVRLIDNIALSVNSEEK